MPEAKGLCYQARRTPAVFLYISTLGPSYDALLKGGSGQSPVEIELARAVKREASKRVGCLEGCKETLLCQRKKRLGCGMEINKLSAGHVQDRLGAFWSWAASSCKRDIICNILASVLYKELWRQAQSHPHFGMSLAA